MPMDQASQAQARAVARVLEQLSSLMRRWERDARAVRWPEELGGGLADVQALRQVERQSGLTAGELARALWMSDSALTAVLNRMEDGGLMVRERESRDRRVVRIALTERGRSVLHAAEEIRAERMSRWFAQLSEEDLDRLTDLLRKMARSADDNLVAPGRE